MRPTPASQLLYAIATMIALVFLIYFTMSSTAGFEYATRKITTLQAISSVSDLNSSPQASGSVTMQNGRVVPPSFAPSPSGAGEDNTQAVPALK